MRYKFKKKIEQLIGKGKKWIVQYSCLSWWNFGVLFFFVLLPTFFATNFNIKFQTPWFTKLPLLREIVALKRLPPNHFTDFIQKFWDVVKGGNFETIALAKGFIALNEACAILPLILFTIILISLLRSVPSKKFCKDLFFLLPMIFCIIVFILLIIPGTRKGFTVLDRTSTLWILMPLIFTNFLIFVLPFFPLKKFSRGTFVLLSIGFCIFLILYTSSESVKKLPLKIEDLAKIFIVYFILPLYIILYLLYLPKNRIYIANKYIVKHIWFHHPVAFPAGLFYNVVIYLYLCIFVTKNNELLDASTNLVGSSLALFSIWSTSLAMWMGPFIRAWLGAFRKDFIDEYYRKTMTQIISDMDEHLVMLGFGGLGQGVQTEIIERMEEKKIKKSIEPILDPSDSSSIRYLAKNMVVVDKDEKLFDHVFCDPSFEKVGVAKNYYRRIEHNGDCNLSFREDELWIPAIIGDIANASVLDYSKLEHCNYFIDTLEGYEESIMVSKFAHDHPKTGGIITVSDSAQHKFLFPRHSGSGVFLSYPTQQRGVSLAEVIYPAMARWLNNFIIPNVLVFTDDLRQTHYMIETILQELKLSNHLSQYIDGPLRSLPYAGEHVDLRITLCSDAEEIKRVCHSKMPKNKFLNKLNVMEWVEIIERCASPEFVWPSEKYYIKSEVIIEKPHLMIMEMMTKSLSPKVVIISYKNMVDILKVLHDCIIAVERYNSLTSNDWKWMPKIIVGCQGKEERDVRDWLQYYDTLCREKCRGENRENWQRYPIQAIDCMVDLNKDSKEQIAAIAEAMSIKG